jgi:hypothetical protein
VARHFASSSDAVSLENLITISGDFSWSMWVYFTGSPTNVQVWISSSTDSGTSLIGVINTNTELYFRPGIGPGLISFVVPPMTAGVWYHIAFARISGIVSCYLNGVESSAGGLSSPGTFFCDTLGAYPFNTAFNLAGNLAEVGLWNVGLSAGEITALASGILPYQIRSQSSTGYWPLYGLTSPEPDFSGNANNGTLTGTTSATGPPTNLFTWTRGSCPILSSGGTIVSGAGVAYSINYSSTSSNITTAAKATCEAQTAFIASQISTTSQTGISYLQNIILGVEDVIASAVGDCYSEDFAIANFTATIDVDAVAYSQVNVIGSQSTNVNVSGVGVAYSTDSVISSGESAVTVEGVGYSNIYLNTVYSGIVFAVGAGYSESYVVSNSESTVITVGISYGESSVIAVENVAVLVSGVGIVNAMSFPLAVTLTFVPLTPQFFLTWSTNSFAMSWQEPEFNLSWSS